MPFDVTLLSELLRCPQSRTTLVFTGEALVCTDPECRLRFPIRDDIPILLIDEATQLPREQWQTLVDAHSGKSAAEG